MKDSASILVMGGLESTVLTIQERAFLEKEKPIGLTLFGRNINQQEKILESLKSLIHSLRSILGAEALIAIDQEGGRVARIKPPYVDNPGPALSLQEGKMDLQSLQWLEDYGFHVAERLFSLGVNLNFAPVVDCLTEPENACIGDRSFSSDPDFVIARAGAYLKGLQKFQKGKVRGCLKHFPGQGHGLFDTHDRLCEINLSQEVLWSRELKPFISLKDHVSFMMTSHAIFTAFDPEKPASLSSLICQDILRKKINYSGILISDDLMMKAISQDEKSWALAVIEAIASGCDIVLVCEGLAPWRLAIEALREEMKKSSAFTSKVEESAKRIIKQTHEKNTSQ